MKYRVLLLLIASLLLPSCSVMMASNKSGVDVDTVQGLRTRTQLIALGAEPVIDEINEKGERIETYKIMKEKGSIARAFMHGLLDIGTLFFWELAGTPIESALSQKKYYSLKVTFNEQDQIQKMELL